MTVATTSPFQAHLDADGWTSGPWRAPVNISADAAGTIHDDATAQALGLRRGTVAGSIHMEQYAPLALHAFGPDWAVRGALSLYFTQATGDGEPVCTRLGPVTQTDAGAFAPAEMRTPEGALVSEGVACLGPPPERGPLRDRLCRDMQRPPPALRILADARVGEAVSNIPARMTATRAESHLRGVTEPLAMFSETPRALPMNLVIDVLRAVETPLLRARGAFVGLYGGIEVAFLAGPVRAEADYLAEGRVLALSETPQTEVVWWESQIADAAGAPVARMLMMTRLMKASSPHWA